MPSQPFSGSGAGWAGAVGDLSDPPGIYKDLLRIGSGRSQAGMRTS